MTTPAKVMKHDPGMRFIVIEEDGIPVTTTVEVYGSGWRINRKKAGETVVLLDAEREEEARGTLEAMFETVTRKVGSAVDQTAQVVALTAKPRSKKLTYLMFGAAALGIGFAGAVARDASDAIAKLFMTPPAPVVEAIVVPAQPPQQAPASAPKVTTPPPSIPALPGSPPATKTTSVTPPAPPKAPEPALSAPAGLKDALLEAPKAQAQAAIDSARKTVAETGADKAQNDLTMLQAAFDKLSSNEKLTPDVVRQLPHDLAQKLTEAGVVATPEEVAAAAKSRGEKELRIVRLEPVVLDKLRDKDGVATVPEAGSWALTNNSVLIPLPGGGDIKRPDDLKTFHLQP